jgi:hypothetical protein
MLVLRLRAVGRQSANSCAGRAAPDYYPPCAAERAVVDHGGACFSCACTSSGKPARITAPGPGAYEV